MGVMQAGNDKQIGDKLGCTTLHFLVACQRNEASITLLEGGLALMTSGAQRRGLLRTHGM